MLHRLRLIAVLSLVFFSAPLLAEPLPIEYFLKDGDYLDVELSPSGKRLAARMRHEGSIVMLVVDRESNEIVGGARPDSGSWILSYDWINDERIVFTYAEDRIDLDRPVATGELYAANYDGTRAEVLAGYRATDKYTGSRLGTKDNDRSSFFLVDTLDDDDREILVIEYPWSREGRYWYDDGQKLPIISRLDVYSGKKKKVEVLPFRRADPLTDANGVVRFVTYRNEDSTWSAAYRESADAEWQELADVFDLNDDMTVEGMNHAGDAVFLHGTTGPDELYTIYRFDLTAKTLTPLFEDIDADIVDWTVDPTTGEVVAGMTRRDKPAYHYADVESEHAMLHKMLAKAFKGRAIDIVSSTEDGVEHMVRVTSDVNPGEYYIFNAESKSADFFWANMSWVDPRILQPMVTDEVPTADGFSLPVRLTLPAGDAPAPLVVHPHGGPHGIADDWRFDRTVQLLANRGYAVLQVNYRGSGGFGRKFQQAGYLEWGGKMIEDIATATRWAMAHPRIDGDRVCAYGGSYGAYAAYMLAAREPELLKCTAGYVGVYDLNMMFTRGDIPQGWGGVGYLKRVLGTDEAALAEFSPVHHAEAIQAETLLIHGDKDNRAPIEHSEAMLKALREAGHEPEWIKLRQSAHGAGSLENRQKLYEGLLSFLDRNLQPAAQEARLEP